MKRLERMRDAIALDDAAGLHHGLGRAQAALTILRIHPPHDLTSYCKVICGKNPVVVHTVRAAN